MGMLWETENDEEGTGRYFRKRLGATWTRPNFEVVDGLDLCDDLHRLGVREYGQHR